MTAPNSSNDPHSKDRSGRRDSVAEDRLFQIIAEYLSAAEAGTPPDRDALVRAHPAFAEQLGSFFENLDAMEGLAGAADPSRPDHRIGERTASFVIPATLRAGSRFGRDGDYDLQEELGRGGMGIVFRAHQLSLNRTVAVKMILSGGLAKEDQIKRFHAEAEAAAALEHPGIVPVYEVDVHDGCHYFSMGYVEGQSLAEKLHDGPLAPRAAAQLMLSIAEAVAYAHEQGVIHRDLKPHNILLDRKSEPKITDFGLAKRMSEASDLTATGMVLGTPSYMPPEQANAQHQEVGPAADVYSLGAILYAMLTGRPPFQAANLEDVLVQVQSKEPVAPRALNPRVPQDLETICLKCLEKSVVRRYSTARLLADEFGRYLRGETIHARPVGRLAKTWRWCRRNPVAAMLISLVAVVATVSPIVAVNYARLADRETRAREDETRARKDADRQRDRADLEAEQTRRALYYTSMTAAHAAFESDQMARSVELLESQIPLAGEHRDDLRSFEWYYLWRVTHPNTLSLGPHQKGIGCVAVSAAGTQVATGSTDQKIRLFDAATGELQTTLEGHVGEVTSLHYLPTSRGELLVSAGSDKTLRFWDLDAAAEVSAAQITLADRPVSIAVATTGDVLAIGQLEGEIVLATLSRDALMSGHGDDSTARRTPAHQLETLRPARRGGMREVAFDPAGKLLALSPALSRTVEVWDVDRNQLRLSRRMPSGVLTISFSSDGRRIAVGGKELIAIWDLESDEVNLLEEFTGVATSVQFSPTEDRYLSVACLNSAVELWDVMAGSRVLSLRQHEAPARTVRYFPDGQRVVSGSSDRTAKIWDLQSALAAREREVIQGIRPITSIEIANEGRLLVAAMGTEIASWNLASRRRAPYGIELANRPYRLAASADTPRLAFGSLPFEVYEYALRSESNPRLIYSSPGLRLLGIAFLPDGRVLSIGVRQGVDMAKLELWVVGGNQGEAVSLSTEATVLPRAVAVSPDATRMALGGSSGRIEVVDLATGRISDRQSLHRAAVTALAWSQDQTLIASAGQDRVVAFWEPGGGAHVIKSKLSHVVSSMAFAPDGYTVATGGSDKTVKLWDTKSGRVKVTLPTTERVEDLAFTPDGRTLVAALYNGELRVWDASPLPVNSEPGGGHR